MAVTIRKSVESDLPALLDIYNHEVEHGVATFDLKPLTLEERAVWFYEHNKENHPLITAELDGKPVGYASLSSFSSKAAYHSTVELSIYVAPDCRGHRIGTLLMEAILNLAKEDPETHLVVSLITGVNEPSIALHKKYGFKYVGTIHESGKKFAVFCGCKGKHLHPFRQNFREVFFASPSR